ncbi:hypothetical protein M0813_03438 [Anaeramoeba flamelloides]|uniref:Uncharacterized protein n=1 Tax=Anaeramoeba flamelloides TaxID=1746091 RepID=A0ABQ8XWU8_9EUKA|nr:hypothetical protein M0813_03438 [Anaeramoeba flamelloides]
MHCVDAFEDAGIYPLKLLKINNDAPIFPAEVKEFSFSNFNYGSRIKMSGQVITSAKFIEHMINQDKRKKEAQKKSSKKHKPPSHLFKQLFLKIHNTFSHKEFNFDDNNIIHISKSSSIEQLNKRLLNDENNRKIAQEKQNKKTNESQLKENQDNLNLHSTENDSPFTLQPRLSKQSINSTTHRHQLYGTDSPIQPTIQKPTKKSHENESITPLSPGRTSITTEKNYFRTDQQQLLTPKRTQEQIDRIDEINRKISNGSKTTIPIDNHLQFQTPNRTPFRSSQINSSAKRLERPRYLSDFEESPLKVFRKNSHTTLSDQNGRYSLVKNKLYHRNTITPTKYRSKDLQEIKLKKRKNCIHVRKGVEVTGEAEVKTGVEIIGDTAKGVIIGVETTTEAEIEAILGAEIIIEQEVITKVEAVHIIEAEAVVMVDVVGKREVHIGPTIGQIPRTMIDLINRPIKDKHPSKIDCEK